MCCVGKVRRSAEAFVRRGVRSERHACRAGVALPGTVESDGDLDEETERRHGKTQRRADGRTTEST